LLETPATSSTFPLCAATKTRSPLVGSMRNSWLSPPWNGNWTSGGAVVERCPGPVQGQPAVHRDHADQVRSYRAREGDAAEPVGVAFVGREVLGVLHVRLNIDVNFAQNR
jgi:hypothetical protein